MCVCACVRIFSNVLPLLFLSTAKSCVFVKDLFGVLLSDSDQLTASEGVLAVVVGTESADTHMHENKTVTV